MLRFVQSFEAYQSAAKIIERDGIEGFYAAKELVDYEMATLLLVAFLRRTYGSMETYPADPSIDARVLETLRQVMPPEYFAALRDGYCWFYMPKLYALDSFSAFAVEYKRRLWPTLEHAYQATKFMNDSDDPFGDNFALIMRILNAKSAHEAKKIAHEPSVKDRIRPDWLDVRENVMRELIRLKYDQHEYVQRTLANTVGYILVEDSPEDSFFGRGEDWTGKDRLGKLWEELRKEKCGY